MDFLKLLFDFISINIWPLLLLAFIFVARRGIGGVLDRLIKLSFSWGGASGGVEAAPPNRTPRDSQLQVPAPEASTSSTSDAGSEELKEKKQEARDWFPEMHIAFLNGEIDKARAAFEALQQSEQGADERHSTEAIYLHLLFLHGKDSSALQRLEELHGQSRNDKQRADSATWLAWIFNDAKDFSKAENIWTSTISLVRDESIKTELMTNLANTYKSAGEHQKGIDLLESRLAKVVNDQDRLSLYQTLAALEKDAGNTEAAAIALEKVVEIAPTDRDKLFDAAYTQSEAKLRLVSVVHYDTLVTLDPKNSAALNNLGVAAHELKLPGKQVAFYRHSIEQGNTLAMANLASSYMNAGFWDEAKQILDKARVIDNPHENVGNTIYRLHASEEEENKMWGEIKKKGESLQRHIRLYGEAYYDKTAVAVNFAGTWLTDEGNEIGVEGSSELKGQWTEKSGGALNLLASSVYKCSIQGTRHHRAASLRYHREPAEERKYRSLLFGSSERTVKCYSYLSRDANSWQIFSVEPDEQLHLTLHRKQS